MTKKYYPSAGQLGLIAGTTLFVTLTGCVTEGPSQRSGYRGRPAVQVQAAVSFQDDYDYYPGYETYYSRTRHEYVYRDGGTWVRRSQPSGVSVNVLLAAPSVRLDFHDSPEQHHAVVVQSYPRNWKRADSKQDDRKDESKDKKGRKDDDKDDRNDRKHN